jgi:hypothetical protein
MRRVSPILFPGINVAVFLSSAVMPSLGAATVLIQDSTTQRSSGGELLGSTRGRLKVYKGIYYTIQLAVKRRRKRV